MKTLTQQSKQLSKQLADRLGDLLESNTIALNEVTIEVSTKNLIEVAEILKSDADLAFAQLTDLCGVDYSTYGMTEWATEDASSEGFSRAVDGTIPLNGSWEKPRFASVIHLLSYEHNCRLRLRSFVDEDEPIIPSLVDVWAAANWYERESFDLYGILYSGHPDLRRILTDYGFVGHPFRKDFPLIGNVEMRYDATERKCVYEPVSIEPRITTPRVIRDDLRYSQHPRSQAGGSPDKSQEEAEK